MVIGTTHAQASVETAARSPHPLTWFILPTLVAVVPTLSWTLLQTDLPRPAASGLPLIATLVVLLILERLFPLHRAWNRWPDTTDLVLLVANRGVDLAVVAITVVVVAAAAEPLALTSVWPSTWPVVLQVTAGIFLGETVRYGLHRISHRPGLWWRVHKTHHQPDRMYTLNGPRLHPLNYLWAAAAHTVPMLFLGAPIEVLLVVMNTTVLFVIFQHANLRLDFRGINQVFATPDVHRIHHAREGSDREANFSIVLVLIDRLFGTYAPVGADIAADGIGYTER